jgi:SAM-dependent methyltransferase
MCGGNVFEFELYPTFAKPEERLKHSAGQYDDLFQPIIVRTHATVTPGTALEIGLSTRPHEFLPPCGPVVSRPPPPPPLPLLPLGLFRWACRQSVDGAAPSCQRLAGSGSPVLRGLDAGPHELTVFFEDDAAPSPRAPLCPRAARFSTAYDRGDYDGPFALTEVAAVPDAGILGLNVGAGGTARRFINVGNVPLVDARNATTHAGGLFALTPTGNGGGGGGGGGGAPIYFLQQDATKRLPFNDQSLQFVFSEHFVEHIAADDCVRFLAEARRLLRPGGLLRLSTPDFALFAEHYLRERGVGATGAAAAGGFFARHYDCVTLSVGLPVLHAGMSSRPMDLVNTLFRSYDHTYIYDWDQLLFVAHAAGWTTENGCTVARAAFRESVLPGGAPLAQFDDPKHLDESIYVEM